LRRLAADAQRNVDANGDVRANIAGRPGWVGARLREGRECLLKSRFGCAIERADQVLAVEPGNGLAQELKRGAVAAQEAALASDWKMR